MAKIKWDKRTRDTEGWNGKQLMRGSLIKALAAVVVLAVPVEALAAETRIFPDMRVIEHRSLISCETLSSRPA
jgi:hypothetical protein